MRIKKISIFGLFDMFNHEILLNQAEHITILYGMNGIGKTTVFKIVDAFFKFDLKKIANIPFNKFYIEFIDGTAFEIINETDIINISKIGEACISFNKKDIYNAIYFHNNESLVLYQEIQKIKCYFIDSQRLISFKSELNSWLSSYQECINVCFTNLIEEIRLVTLRSNDLYDKLWSQKDNFYRYSNEELISEIESINRIVENLKKVGLFDKESDKYTFKLPQGTLQSWTYNALCLKITYAKESLAIFDDIYARTSLFLEILNERRLTFKQISIDTQKGFVFINVNGKELFPNQLSPGEQHQIILLNFLLFTIPANSLILIDEPEISLHIDWQREFIQDMEKILKLREFDIVLATHSPDIVNGRSELTVSVKPNRIPTDINANHLNRANTL